MESTLLVLVLIVAIVVALVLFLNFFPLGLWISAAASGVRISIMTLIGMRFRRINPSRIVMPMIKATKAGLNVNMNQLETLLLAGGSVDRVVDSLIAAQSAQIPLEF